MSPRQKGKRIVRVDRTIYGSQELTGKEATALRLLVSDQRRANLEREQMQRAIARRPRVGEDSLDFKIAIRAVELRIVRGLFVLELSLPPEGVPAAKQHGLEYMVERQDHYLAGRYLQRAPSPEVPSAREITAAKEASKWIDAIPGDEDRRFFRLAAQSKRGERERSVAWDRVFSRLTHLKDTPPRTLQERYQRCLRLIVADHMLRQMEK
jgi:hypothetical protein